MEPSDVLERLNSAREKIAQTVAHTEAGRDQLQAVFGQTSEQLAALSEDFNATLAHIQEQSARARDAAQQVIEHLLKAGQELWQQAQENGNGLDALAKLATETANGNDSGGEAIDGHAGQVAERLAQTDTLFQQVAQGSGEARDSQHEVVSSLEAAMGTWRSETDSLSQQQRNTADQMVQELTELHASQFVQAMTQQIDIARTEFEEREQQIDAFAHQQEEALRVDRQRAKGEMNEQLEAMGNALENLGELVDSTATTMTKGADEAKELMQMTNIGVRTVIGLIENLQKIFDEIESAWS